MTKKDISNKITELSNKVHRKTLRGGAELILLSERVYDLLEEDIHNSTYKNKFHVMQPSEWEDPPKAPCDIRAIYFGGNLDYKVFGDDEDASYGDNLNEKFQSETVYSEGDEYEPLSIPDIEIEYTEEPVDNIVEEYTFE